MSTDATKEAWRTHIESTGAKFTLLALADHATREGNEGWRCWPSIRRLMAFTGYSNSTVRAHLEWLEANHFIKRERRGDRRRTDGGYQYFLNRSVMEAARDPYFAGLSPRPANEKRSPDFGAVGRDTIADLRIDHRQISARPIDEPSLELPIEPLSQRGRRTSSPWARLVEEWSQVWPDTRQFAVQNERARDQVLKAYGHAGLTLELMCEELTALKRARSARGLKVRILPEAIRGQSWDSILLRLDRSGDETPKCAAPPWPIWNGPPHFCRVMENADPQVTRWFMRSSWDANRGVVLAPTLEAAERIRLFLGDFHMQNLKIAAIEVRVTCEGEGG